MRLLFIWGRRTDLLPLKKTALEKPAAQSTGAASPSAPVLYWIPAGGFQVGVLNRGSSPHSAMSSTYWDSAERAKIVSHYFLTSGVTSDFADFHDQGHRSAWLTRILQRHDTVVTTCLEPSN